jgi:signal transduction histidine kinase/HAMP domain-containing protein
VRPLSSLRLRIVAAFVAAVVTMLSAVIFLIWQFRSVAHTQALITAGYLPLSARMDQIREAHQSIDTDIERILRGERRPITGPHSQAALNGERLRVKLLETLSTLKTATALTRDPGELAVLNKVRGDLMTLEGLVKDYQERSLEFVALSEEGHKDEADALAEPLRRTGVELAGTIDKLDSLLENRIRNLTRETDQQRRNAITVAGGLAGVAVGSSVGLLVAVLLAMRPIGQLTDHVQRLAQGERPGRLDARGDDEIALLAREFDRMVDAIELRDQTLTERAEQLDRLSRYLGSVLDNLEDALFVVENAQVTLANPASQRWEVAPGKPPPARVAPFVDQLGVHEHKDGGSDYEVRVMPFGGSGVIVVAADVTEQRRALEQLSRSERLALIGQMLAQITHEVRNPLNAMSLNAEMLAEELEKLDPHKDTDAHELLATVSGEIHRLTEVTAHYLQLARRPKATLAPEVLSELVSDVVRLVQAELHRAGVTLEVDCEPLLPQRVDGNQLRQALLNVLRNAVEAGAQRLRLAVRQVDSETSGTHVHVSLTDNGPGMTPTEVERAFDPFFSTKASGTGLGLAITRQILEDHDGHIEVVSAPGEGATITLVLPYRPSAPAEL